MTFKPLKTLHKAFIEATFSHLNLFKYLLSTQHKVKMLKTHLQPVHKFTLNSFANRFSTLALSIGLVASISACQKSVPTGKVKVISPYTFQVTKFSDGRHEHATALSALKYADAYPVKPENIAAFLAETLNVDLFAYENAYVDLHLVDYASIKGPKEFTLSYAIDYVVRRAKNGEIMAQDSFICREDGRVGFQAAETLAEVSEGKRPMGQDEKVWNRLEKQCMMSLANRLAIDTLAWHNAKLAEK